MNKKGKELISKLNKTKIVDDDLIKSIESTNFMVNLNKKNEDLKLFTDETYKKINI